MKNENHAVQNAEGWVGSIAAMVAALECDYSRLDELKNIDSADMTKEEAEEMRELVEESTIDGDEMEKREDAEQRIQESALSVEVRDDWRAVGDDVGDAVEFQILLSTGGPALRIMGELDEHNQPRRAWLEYQDWGTPWTHHVVKDFAEVLLMFCQQFYFGE